MRSVRQDSQQFKVMKNGKQFGPYTRKLLLENIKMGNFSFEDLIWHSKTHDWEPICQHFSVEELTRVKTLMIESEFSGKPQNKQGGSDGLFSFHPTVSTLAIGIDILIFILALPKLGWIILSVLPLSLITFLIQHKRREDSFNIALSKAVLVALITGIPIPLFTTLILCLKLFDKK